MNYLICIHRSGYNLHSSQTHHWLQKRSFRGSVLCQNLPGGEVWSYGRSNSDVQQKMLKRLEEYEEASSLGGWSPETLRWIFGTRFRGWWWVNVSWYRFLWRKFGSICDCNSTGCFFEMNDFSTWLIDPVSFSSSIPNRLRCFLPINRRRVYFLVEMWVPKAPTTDMASPKTHLKIKNQTIKQLTNLPTKNGAEKTVWLNLTWCQSTLGFDGLKG